MGGIVFLSVCWAVVYTSLVRLVNCLSLASGFGAVVSARTIVGGSALYLPCNHGEAAVLIEWARQWQDKFHNAKVHGLTEVANHPVAKPSGAQQCQ